MRHYSRPILLLLVCVALSGCSAGENANTSGNANATGNANTGVNSNANTSVNTNTAGNANGAVTTASPAEYNLPYEAIKDTEWISNPNAPNPTKGNLKKGDRIHFNREPSPSGATWQDAKLSDGKIRFVHPADFKKL